MSEALSVFIFFFAVIDPIGTVPVFLNTTQRMNTAERRLTALTAAGAAFLILLFFAVAGELLLRALGIPLAAFEVAGGAILFLFALTMIFGEGKPGQELQLEGHRKAAIYPLAIPSIASPGAILGAVMMTEQAHFQWWEQVTAVILMGAVVLVTLCLMLLAGRVQKLIGMQGAAAISRVMGMILASVATHQCLGGLKTYFS